MNLVFVYVCVFISVFEFQTATKYGKLTFSANLRGKRESTEERLFATFANQIKFWGLFIHFVEKNGAKSIWK